MSQKPSEKRQVVRFAFYKLDSAWRRLPAERQASAKLEFGETIESFAGRLLLRPYGLVGIRGDCDFLLWQVAELFAIAATCARAHAEARQGNKGAIALADVFCKEARLRIDTLFDQLYGPTDDSVYRVSQQVLKGEHAWLESGVIGMADYETAEKWEAAAAANEAEVVNA